MKLVRALLLTFVAAAFAPSLAHAQPAPAPDDPNANGGANGNGNANVDGGPENAGDTGINEDNGTDVQTRQTQARQKQDPPGGCGCTSSSTPADVAAVLAVATSLLAIGSRRRRRA